MFHFTPLLGARCASPASQSLLELDGGVKVLIDVGWDESFDVDKLQALEKHVSTLSIILLTHPTINHIGAYAHCCKHIPLFSKIPVYATTPVINLGRTLLTDLYNSSPLAATIIPKDKLSSHSDLLLEPPTPEEIAEYFAAVHPLRYSQPHQPVPSAFSPPLGNLTVTAYGAGHTLGGTIWHVQHSLESIVYAADWNQGKETLISGATWLGSVGGAAEIIEPLRRPTALICSSRGVEKSNPVPRKKRDDTLISLIRETTSHGGKVLIPTDSAARVLELAFLLDNTWRENLDGPHAETYKNVGIYMAGTTSASALRNLRSMLEWLDDSVRAETEAAERADGAGPLSFKHVRPLQRARQLERVLAKDKACVMLASSSTAEWGFSRQILKTIAADSRNLVILTETAVSGTAKHLWDIWHSQAGNDAQSAVRIVDGAGRPLNLREVTAEPLGEEEETLYQQYTSRQRQIQNAFGGDLADAAATEAADDQMSESSDSEDEEDDAEQQGRALNLSAQQNKRKAGLSDAELGINVLLRSKNVHDYDVRNRRGREKMFPFQTQRSKTDDFGEVIKPEDYLRAEERDAVDGVDMRETAQAGIGQKRKWQQAEAMNKKAKSEPDDIDAAIARATGEDEEEDDESDYEPEAQKGPRKAIFTEEGVICNLRIAHVDFSGLHEKRDMQMLIPLIRPRNLILILGEEAETRALSEECRQLLEGADIFLPNMGEMVDASVDTNAWSLKLSQQLVNKLAWQNVKGLGIVALTGKLGLADIKDEEESATKKAKLEGTEEKPTTIEMPVLDLFQQQQQQQITQPVHVGDLRLASLRQLVTASGHTAEFRGEGTLLVDGTVVVRKGKSGHIEVEAGAGGLSVPQYRTREGEGSFYAVRKLIYDGLAVVAGA